MSTLPSLPTLIPNNATGTSLQTLQKTLQTLTTTSLTKTTELITFLSTSDSPLLNLGPSLAPLPSFLDGIHGSLAPVILSVEGYKREVNGVLGDLKVKKFEVERYKFLEVAVFRMESVLKMLIACEGVASSFDGVDYDADEKNIDYTMLDYKHIDEVTSSLERSTQSTIYLASLTSYIQNNGSLPSSTSMSTESESQEEAESTEHANEIYTQFILSLIPRIRNVTTKLINHSVHTFKALLNARYNGTNSKTSPSPPSPSSLSSSLSSIMSVIRTLSQLCPTGTNSVTSIFKSNVMLPLIQRYININTIHDGGPRGKCTNLKVALDQIVTFISSKYGEVLVECEETFNYTSSSTTMTSTSELLAAPDFLIHSIHECVHLALTGNANMRSVLYSAGIADCFLGNYNTLIGFENNFVDSLLGPSGEFESVKVRFKNHVKKDANKASLAKLFNLPIYYQLRFTEATECVNDNVTLTANQGLRNTGEGERDDNNSQFKIRLIKTLANVLERLYKPEVMIRVLGHRFFRGSLMIINRVLVFFKLGLDGEDYGKIWRDDSRNLRLLATDLSKLKHWIINDLCTVITSSLQTSNSTSNDEVNALTKNILKEITLTIPPLLTTITDKIDELLYAASHQHIVSVKGVAATYRMTNRPKPSKSSLFVNLAFRDIVDFVNNNDDSENDNNSNVWNPHALIKRLTSSYTVLLKDLLITVKATEDALRKKGKSNAGGRMQMMDSEKVLYQCYLDVNEFVNIAKGIAGGGGGTGFGLEELVEVVSDGVRFEGEEGV